jgi:anaerobic ribonucleoside-triphosphate reductase
MRSWKCSVLKLILKKENKMEKVQMKEEVQKIHVVRVKQVPTEIYSRVVGYFRPVNNWNEGKKEEFQDRKEFKL